MVPLSLWYYVGGVSALILLGAIVAAMLGNSRRKRYLREKTLFELRDDLMYVLRHAKVEKKDFKEAQEVVNLYMSTEPLYVQLEFTKKYSNFDRWLEQRYNEC